MSVLRKVDAEFDELVLETLADTVWSIAAPNSRLKELVARYAQIPSAPSASANRLLLD